MSTKALLYKYGPSKDEIKIEKFRKIEIFRKFNLQQSNHIIRQYEIDESVYKNRMWVSALSEKVWMQTALKIWKEGNQKFWEAPICLQIEIYISYRYQVCLILPLLT